MPQRDPNLPEGTDRTFDASLEPNPPASGPGFIAGSDASVLGDDTGGFAGTGNRQGGRVVDQFKGEAQNLRQQATTKVRDFAVDGKDRATTALDDFSGVIRETADSIDERLGAEYGQYARRAADTVQDFAQSIRAKDVDELYADAREIVRKSPVVAIGAAAAVGFALVRLVKAGFTETDKDIDFRPDPTFGATAGAGTPPPVSARDEI